MAGFNSWRIKMNLWDQFRIDLDLGKLLCAGKDGCKTALEFARNSSRLMPMYSGPYGCR